MANFKSKKGGLVDQERGQKHANLHEWENMKIYLDDREMSEIPKFTDADFTEARWFVVRVIHLPGSKSLRSSTANENLQYKKIIWKDWTTNS